MQSIQDLNRDTKLKATNGQHLPAMLVFTRAIEYLKGHFLNMAKKRTDGFNETDIFWVLTVPAIWNDNAKQFMREAAQQVSSNFQILFLYTEHQQVFNM